MSLCLQCEHPDMKTLRSLRNHNDDAEDNFEMKFYYEVIKFVYYYQNCRKAKPRTQR